MVFLKMNGTPPPVEGRGRCIAVWPGGQATLITVSQVPTVSHDSPSMSSRKLSMCSTTLAPLVALLVVSRVVGQNVANLHFCPGPKKKCALLSQKNDLLSRFVINGGIFCPGTERRKSGTERRKNGTERVGQKGRDRTSHIRGNF